MLPVSFDVQRLSSSLPVIQPCRMMNMVPFLSKLELEERTSVARVRPRDRYENGGDANGGGGGGRGRGRGRRTGGGGGIGGSGRDKVAGANGDAGGEHDGENGDAGEGAAIVPFGGGGEGRGRRVPPVAENSVYIKGFPESTTEDDIRAEVSASQLARRAGVSWFL